MALSVFNSLTRRIEEFAPLDQAGRKVGLYCCGPTVYDLAHIGNFRTFVLADIVRRYLDYRGYAVRHVMNITDVEDKIIKRVRETGIALRDFTSKYEKAFFEDLQTLGCRMPHQTPRATENIPAMIELIERLMAQGFAYCAPDGSVYFSIEKYQQAGRKYGQLVNLNLEQLRPGEHVRSDEYEKEAVADFALWKGRIPEDGQVFWPSPWGEGRPGWHIECSAMSMNILGNSFDLHLGGEDLAFPHHEDEIAQSEGAGLQTPGQRFVKYWIHGAHLLVEGKKMSKSLGNFYTLRDLLERGYQGREIRYMLLSAHYRESFNFTLEGLTGARSALGRIDECFSKMKELAGGTSAPPLPAIEQAFTAALDNDLNISAAWAVIFDWVRECNRKMAERSMSADEAASSVATWSKINVVLGVEKPQESLEAPPEVHELLAARQAARQARDFNKADTLRDEIKKRGWLIEDTPNGPKLKPL